ncbi:hypothetical protein ABZ805_07400 [Saccharopolyspora sp. NPDC047091]|uniref:hypothetical protein n=1 Tax=Saccharopolyspora sp. NPDC047091 TaxID=3155924 RepID=UPI0033D9D2DD
MTATATPTVRPIPEFEGVHDVWPRGDRLEAVREAAGRYRERFLSQGTIRAIRSIDIAAAPYPSRYAFQGYNLSLNPMISIINRMFVIQFEGFDGELKTLVWEPTVAAGSVEAPFYAKLQRIAGDFLSDKVFAKYYNDPDEVLPRLGLRNSDVDYVSFDHLHVQDVRMIMGSDRVIPGEREPRAPLFPGAKLLVHRKELATLESPHPMQWAWYVDGGMDGVPAERLEVLDGDVELGVGVSLLWTPGHTDGNHSLVVNTPDGVWVSSENGIGRRQLAARALQDPGGEAAGPVLQPGSGAQRQHAGGLARPVRLDGQGEDDGLALAPRPALAADHPVLGVRRLEAAVAGRAHLHPRRARLRRDLPAAVLSPEPARVAAPQRSAAERPERVNGAVSPPGCCPSGRPSRASGRRRSGR